MRAWRKKEADAARPGRRLLGLTDTGAPLFEPRPSHSLLYAPAGAGKTTCGVMPWLLSMLADPSRALVITDSKNGELAAQAAGLAAAFGRKVALIDDTGVLGRTHPLRIELAATGSILAAAARGDGSLIFATDNAAHALIPEPTNDQKNQYFRDGPRSLIEFAALVLLKRSPRLATPGGLWSTLADPAALKRLTRIEAEEGEAQLAALARSLVDLAEHTPDHWAQHLQAALKALRIYAAGSALHEAGLDASLTHADLLREGYVTFLIGPVQHMERLGAHYGLHLQSFLDALYQGIPGRVDFILEEVTNAPLKRLVSALTTMRGFGGSCHFVVQSRSELIRAFGERETETVEENAIVKQWFGFGSFAEAERIAKAIGEEFVLQEGLGLTSANLGVSHNYSKTRAPILAAEALLAMGAETQLVHVKGVGFLKARKIAQHQ
ncbi:MAG: type IV secretory system conjugative DNA transfer family protein, partial [Pseudomonadota bacterium]